MWSDRTYKANDLGLFTTTNFAFRIVTSVSHRTASYTIKTPAPATIAVVSDGAAAPSLTFSDGWDQSCSLLEDRGPCYEPEKYGISWRNTDTWCEANKDSGKLELNLANRFAQQTEYRGYVAQHNDVSMYWTYMAGVIKTVMVDDNGSSNKYICGCKQTGTYMKRRAQHYTHDIPKVSCPANRTLSVGPDILGKNWCPMHLPWRTEGVITGCLHSYHRTYYGINWKSNCELTPNLPSLFG